VSGNPSIPDAPPRRFESLDAVFLVFLAGLAFLPPRVEWHKQLILLAIGVVQLVEGPLTLRFPRQGAIYIVLGKIVLAFLLIDHTGEIGINSSYWPIFFMPVVTAALYFGPRITLVWTALSSAAYCSYLYPALKEYDITDEGFAQLAVRVMFFFLAAMLVNRFVLESRRQTRLYQDVAERLAETNRQLELAQEQARRSERLAALGQLSAGLAHEIRNPLGVIKGSAEMLSQKLEGSDELARELAGYISSEVNRLGGLVTQFLNFARPLEANRQATDVTVLLDRVLKNVGDHWNGKPAQVERVYAPGLPQISLDESLAEQAFVNLIQNAYEAMEETGGTLRIEAAPSTQNGRPGVAIHISDSGPGIPDELREQIFNPFVTTKKTGVGLGLSIVSKIIDGHHGSIRAERAPKGGALFIVFLPGEEPVAA